jgi:hypothetical protein
MYNDITYETPIQDFDTAMEDDTKASLAILRPRRLL